MHCNNGHTIPRDAKVAYLMRSLNLKANFCSGGLAKRGPSQTEALVLFLDPSHDVWMCQFQYFFHSRFVMVQ